MITRIQKPKGPAGAGKGSGKGSDKGASAQDAPDISEIPNTPDTSGCVCFALRKSARAVTQIYDAALGPSGLRATQFSLLAVLRAGGPLTVSKLAEAMVMDRTTLTRNITPVERRGLVKTAPGRRDKRTRVVSLTAKGRKRLSQADPLWTAVQAHMRKALGAKRSDQLLFELDIAAAAALGR